MPYTYYIYTRARAWGLLVVAALWLVACSSADEQGDSAPAAVRMPVYISIPATDVYDATRAPGDPGTYEHFGLPRYLCVMLVEVSTTGGTTTRKVVAKLVNYELESGPDSWRNMVNNEQTNPSQTPTQPDGTYAGDSIYTYVGSQITIELPTARTGKTAEVYAALSPQPFMTVDGTRQLVSDDIPTSYDDLLAMTVSFEADPAGSYAYLRDVYATPANLHQQNLDAKPYYGTISSEKYATEFPALSLLLYHMAAKLDLQWNVSDAVKTAGGVSTIMVSGMKHRACRLFQPMTNEGAGADTYTETITTDLGNRYYGRHSLYVIPYVTAGTTTFPVAMQATLNDDTPTTKSATQQVTLDPAAVFTPWVVGALNIK